MAATSTGAPLAAKDATAKRGNKQNNNQEQNQNQNSNQDKSQDENQNSNPKSKVNDIVLGMYIHCEGCAALIVKSLRGFEGVEDIVTDRKSHKVTVKGKNADPLKVQQRLQKKTKKNVELISPKVNPKEAKEKADKAKAEAAKKEEEKKQQVIVVTLKVHMHCENCAHDVKKCVLKMEEVMTVEVDQKKSQMTVKGRFDPAKLVTFMHKRAGKHVEILKQEKDGDANKKKEGGGGGGGNKDTNNKKGKDQLYIYYPPQIAMENVYPPQIFSDENVNACLVM